MKRVSFLLSLSVFILLPISVAHANSGDFSGGVAIGSTYAASSTAPINGLIVGGNTGIGTSAPTNLLDVYNGDARIYNSGNEARLRLANTSTGGRDYWLISGGAGGSFSGGKFGVWDNTANSVRLSINSGGQIYIPISLGIGTSTPTQRLEIDDAGASTILLRTTGTAAKDWYISNGAAASQAFSVSDAAGYRFVITNSGAVGIGTVSPRGSSTLDVNGTVYVGSFAAGSSTTVCQNGNVLSSCTSAMRFKENIKPSELGLKEVLAMKPITFDLRNHDGWEKHDFGFLAEDMQKLNPLFVTFDKSGKIEGVRYMQLTAVNAKAIQELHTLIEKQQREIDELKKLVAQLKH